MENTDLHGAQPQGIDLGRKSEKTLAHNWTLIVAVSSNGVIGRSGELPWKLRTDLRRFKQMTMGHCLLMGRKTFESIGRLLPGRQTIVLSRQSPAELPLGVCWACSLNQVEERVESKRRVMVVGGAEIYRLALPFCSHLWITRVQADVVGDTLFPELDWSQWQLLSSVFEDSGPGDDWPTEFQQWQRIKPAS
jgi:dihydrofolate reductase